MLLNSVRGGSMCTASAIIHVKNIYDKVQKHKKKLNRELFLGYYHLVTYTFYHTIVSQLKKHTN